MPGVIAVRGGVWSKEGKLDLFVMKEIFCLSPVKQEPLQKWTTTQMGYNLLREAAVEAVVLQETGMWLSAAPRKPFKFSADMFLSRL